MLNPSQEIQNPNQHPNQYPNQHPNQHRNQLNPTNPSNGPNLAHQVRPMKPVLIKSPNVHEIEQMLANQRLAQNFSHNPGFYPNQMPNLPPAYIPNQIQPNYFKLTTGQSNPVNPMSHLNANQPGLRSQNVINAPGTMFNVPNIRRYLDPNYENLNSLAGHPIQGQPMNSSALQPSASGAPMNALPTNQPATVNRNLISPNITGLPEASVVRKQNSPSTQGNAYANSSIVSRYCPPQAEPQKYPINQFSSYRETNIDHIPRHNPPTKAASSRCGASTNDLNSLYDPVYYRTNSQLSFDSKDDSVTYSTYAPPSLRSLSNAASNSPCSQPSSLASNLAGNLASNSLSNPPSNPGPTGTAAAAAGNRQPITELLNNDLEENSSLAYDKSLGRQALKENSGIIDHLRKNEKEVDYLTSLLVKGLQSSTEADFFGKFFQGDLF